MNRADNVICVLCWVMFKMTVRRSQGIDFLTTNLKYKLFMLTSQCYLPIEGSRNIQQKVIRLLHCRRYPDDIKMALASP